MSQLSQPPAFTYPNQRVIRPPLPRAQRNRVLVAGAVSNTVLTAGLTILTGASILFLIVAIFTFVWAILPASQRDGRYQPFDDMLAAVGLSPEQGWVAWVVLIGTMIVGAAVSWAGIWIGKSMIASAGVARPWAVAWSASGILVGIGFITSAVFSPMAGPLMAVVFGAVAASGTATGADARDMGLVVLFSLVATLFSLVVYAAAGLFVWWWMAHALRRAE